MQDEEQGGAGIATVLCTGAKLTKAGAAFVNAEMILAGGKWDTFRMLTHPGTAILPAALVGGGNRRRFRAASSSPRVAAGYEVMERMAADFIPTVMSRGFHAGPVFGIFGAAIAAAKMQRPRRRPDPRRDRPVRQPGGGQPGGRAQRRPLAARGRRRAQRLARCRHGQAWHARRRDGAGGRGRLLSRLRRQQPRAADATASPATPAPTLPTITEGLGQDWMFLETLYRIYSTAGYNIAHVDVTARLCAEHDISYDDIDRIEAVVNWLETRVPEPGLPDAWQRRQAARRQHRSTSPPTARSSAAIRCCAAAQPARRDRSARSARPDASRDADPVGAPHAVRPARHDLHQGRPQLHAQGTGREFIWDFEEHARRIRVSQDGTGSAKPSSPNWWIRAAG